MHKTACRKVSLTDLVGRFSISFRLRPAYAANPGEGAEVGCEVELIGEHYAMGQHVDGGCPHCLRVLLVLFELHDRTLSGQGAVEHLSAQCEKVIHYASTARDWPEVVLDVKIVRRVPIPDLLPENWVATLIDEIRRELLNLGCSEIPFVYMPPEPVVDRGFLLAQRAV